MYAEHITIFHQINDTRLGTRPVYHSMPEFPSLHSRSSFQNTSVVNRALQEVDLADVRRLNILIKTQLTMKQYLACHFPDDPWAGQLPLLLVASTGQGFGQRLEHLCSRSITTGVLPCLSLHPWYVILRILHIVTC